MLSNQKKQDLNVSQRSKSSNANRQSFLGKTCEEKLFEHETPKSTERPTFFFHSKKRNEEKEKIILDNKRFGKRLFKVKSQVVQTRSLLKQNAQNQTYLKSITRYKPGSDPSQFVIMDSIVSNNGNYNLKDSYKSKYNSAAYVNAQMNGVA